MNTIKLAPLLLIFVEVANKRSFSAAAKKLGMSKSAISQQIKRLEQEIGQQLLARNTRGVALTAVGQSLLSRSELLSAHLSQTLKELDQVKTEPSGCFKIAVPPFFEQHIVIPALKQLCLAYPKLKPELVITGKWQDLREYNLDAAIFGGNLRDSQYRALPIGKVAEIFCASPRYLQQHNKITELNQLSQHQYLATPWQQQQIQLFEVSTKQAHTLNLDHAAKTNTLSTVLEMLLNDMGIALFPAFLAQQQLANQQLIQVLPNYQGRAWQFYFLHAYQGDKPAHVERFYQLICYYFKQRNS
ncbi:LysR family transcriptional regulator [Motilimonas sp. KMU-193]|uniref:LysR family transcriptional regulator n=1 Tax=Motilimonas sp. KMU-193 TaxID=3388668 RepID=UPI00396B3A51